MSRVVEQKNGKDGNLWVKLNGEVDEAVAAELGLAVMEVQGRGHSKPFKAVGPYGSGIKALIRATNMSFKISSLARKKREAADRARSEEIKKNKKK